MSQSTKSLPDSAPRATRLTPPDGLKVTARTLGTARTFDISVSNISRSGLLLEWPSTKNSLPFIQNTLLEIEFSAKFKGEPKRVSCLGKVVRKTGESNQLHYGVRVIHNDDQDHLDWMSIITMYEKTLNAPLNSDAYTLPIDTKQGKE
jgi:PilZ domain